MADANFEKFEPGGKTAYYHYLYLLKVAWSFFVISMKIFLFLEIVIESHVLLLVMKVTQKEMADAKLPLSGRDYCAHLLIPLLKCRKETYMVPWKCHHEKHLWERCEYDE